jgi:hypothetical protein
MDDCHGWYVTAPSYQSPVERGGGKVCANEIGAVVVDLSLQVLDRSRAELTGDVCFGNVQVVALCALNESLMRLADYSGLDSGGGVKPCDLHKEQLGAGYLGWGDYVEDAHSIVELQIANCKLGYAGRLKPRQQVHEVGLRRLDSSTISSFDARSLYGRRFGAS